MTTNLSAFLAVIRACEHSAADFESGECYRTLFGGSKFTGYADHPNKAITAGGYTSTAAGAYQILYSTWQGYVSATGPHDFSPDNQDLCARWLIDRRHATAAVESGDLGRAIALCGQEWASLPGSPYGQPVRTMEFCLQVYAAHGGMLVTVPRTVQPTPAPTQLPPNQPRAHMGAELLVSLIPSVLSLFSGRAQAAIAKATGDPVAAQKFTADIAKQIEVVSGIAVSDPATAMKAAAEVASDPVKLAALEQHATNFVLTEVGGGVQGARDQYNAIAKDYDDDSWQKMVGKFLLNPVHWVTGVFLSWIQQFVPPLKDKVAALDSAAALGLIMLIFAVIAIVAAFWLGNYLKSPQSD